MLGWLILFIASGSLLILFIILKLAQERYHVLLFWPDQREKIEQTLQREKHAFLRSIHRVDNTTVFILIQKFGFQLKNIVVSAYEHIDVKSNQLAKMINGQQYIESVPKARTSRFLRDVRSFRDRFRRQK